MEDLVDRLQKLEDRVALEDLVKRYFLASDDDDPAALESLFTQDGVFLVSGHPCGATAREVADFITAERKKMGLTNHVLDSVLLELDGFDQARGLVRAHLELVYNGVAVTGAVRYHDDYVKQAGRWRLKRRNMMVLYLAPWAEVPAAIASGQAVRWPGLDPSPTDLPRVRP